MGVRGQGREKYDSYQRWYRTRVSNLSAVLIGAKQKRRASAPRRPAGLCRMAAGIYEPQYGKDSECVVNCRAMPMARELS